MSGQPFITVDISEDGSAKVEAHGFVGKSCESATESIENAISGKGAKKVKYKGEYYSTTQKETITTKAA